MGSLQELRLHASAGGEAQGVELAQPPLSVVLSPPPRITSDAFGMRRPEPGSGMGMAVGFRRGSWEAVRPPNLRAHLRQPRQFQSSAALV